MAEYRWTDAWKSFKNVVWYKYVTFSNHGGDLVSWIESETDTEKAQHCKALVRREDGLILMNTLSCRPCTTDEATRWSRRGRRYDGGYYFAGTGILGENYDGFGRQHN